MPGPDGQHPHHPNNYWGGAPGRGRGGAGVGPAGQASGASPGPESVESGGVPQLARPTESGRDSGAEAQGGDGGAPQARGLSREQELAITSEMERDLQLLKNQNNNLEAQNGGGGAASGGPRRASGNESGASAVGGRGGGGGVGPSSVPAVGMGPPSRSPSQPPDGGRNPRPAGPEDVDRVRRGPPPSGSSGGPKGSGAGASGQEGWNFGGGMGNKGGMMDGGPGASAYWARGIGISGVVPGGASGPYHPPPRSEREAMDHGPGQLHHHRYYSSNSGAPRDGSIGVRPGGVPGGGGGGGGGGGMEGGRAGGGNFTAGEGSAEWSGPAPGDDRYLPHRGRDMDGHRRVEPGGTASGPGPGAGTGGPRSHFSQADAVYPAYRAGGGPPPPGSRDNRSMAPPGPMPSSSMQDAPGSNAGDPMPVSPPMGPGSVRPGGGPGAGTGGTMGFSNVQSVPRGGNSIIRAAVTAATPAAAAAAAVVSENAGALSGEDPSSEHVAHSGLFSREVGQGSILCDASAMLNQGFLGHRGLIYGIDSRGYCLCSNIRCVIGYFRLRL